ncbi:unnamed protein product [Urochloa humidicola]
MAIPLQSCASFLLVLLLPGCLLRHTAAKSQPVGEAELLLQIKRAWGDPPMLAEWSTASGAHCRWPRVGCDPAGRVTSTIGITGPIPDAVGGLSSLTHLDVSDNNIVGVFPTTLYRCSSLLYLDLSGNYIEGELPVDMGHDLGANLSTLNLGFNRFNGTVPASLSRLWNLRYLGLDENRLTGTIPAELGYLTCLEHLSLKDNLFDAGELPASFKNLTRIVSLSLSNCNLVGDIPSYLVTMLELEKLHLGKLFDRHHTCRDLGPQKAARAECGREQPNW